MSKQKQFVTACTLTFKAFDFDVTMTNGKSTLWNFVTFNPNNKRSYAVFCAPSATKAKGLIKVALKKLPKEHRLVVVTEEFNETETEEAQKNNYCLVQLSTLKNYGQEMLEIRSNESIAKQKEEYDPNDSVIDQAINRDRLF